MIEIHDDERAAEDSQHDQRPDDRGAAMIAGGPRQPFAFRVAPANVAGQAAIDQLASEKRRDQQGRPEADQEERHPCRVRGTNPLMRSIMMASVRPVSAPVVTNAAMTSRA